MDFSKRIQKYVNYTTVEEAMAAGFDIVQPKYDGWWARCVIANGEARIYSRQGQLKAVKPVAFKTLSAVLIGEFLVGTQRATGRDESGRLVAFDCIESGGESLSGVSYARRMTYVETIVDAIDWVDVTESLPATHADTAWLRFVEEEDGEGVIFRRSGDTYAEARIGRVKRQVTMDYVVMAVVEGGGRLAGKAGAVVCGLYENGRLVEKVRVGGGWSDAERLELFTQPTLFIGRVLEVKGYQVFESGSMRHPNAARWREDKQPIECVWAG